MKRFFRKFQDRQADYESLIEVRIDKNALLHNLDACARMVSPRRVAPVLKSNAYGHGLVEVARVLEGHAHVAFVVVDSYYEVRVLRTEGMNAPMLVLGHTLTENILNNPFPNVSFCVATLSQLAELDMQVTVPIAIHIKIDTGMHRQGIMPDEISRAADICIKNTHIRAEGLCSHLADADNEEESFTRAQITIWNETVALWRSLVPATVLYHLSATKGTRFASDIDANVMRLGLGLYGIDSVHTDAQLRPALELRTRITALRTIGAGESVGYNHTWTATREKRVATIPVGYYEGVDRRLSNKGWVSVRGKECPIIGRVSMNMTTIDVTDVPGVAEGDEVIVIHKDPHAKNSVWNMAVLAETIPYDILVHIPAALRRIVI